MKILLLSLCIFALTNSASAQKSWVVRTADFQGEHLTTRLASQEGEEHLLETNLRSKDGVLRVIVSFEFGPQKRGASLSLRDLRSVKLQDVQEVRVYELKPPLLSEVVKEFSAELKEAGKVHFYLKGLVTDGRRHLDLDLKEDEISMP